MYKFRQGDLSVIVYFTGLKSLFDELDIFSLVLTCTCDAIAFCICHALLRVKEQRNFEYAVHFLKGLNDSLISPMFALLSPLPLLNRMLFMVIQTRVPIQC